MTEQKNSSEKTEKTDRNEKPASAPKKPSIEPKSARGASTTARRKTAEEADAALQDKIEKARAGAMPERREPAAAGESAGLPPVQTVRAMPQINRKKDETMSDEKAAAPAKKTDKSQKAAAKKPSAPIKMPERDATGRFLPSEEKAKKPRAKAKAQQARTEDVKKPSDLVLEALGQGARKYSEIATYTKLPASSLASVLNQLVSLDLISKDYPINAPDNLKKAQYVFRDNMVHFYYKYIYKNISHMGFMNPEKFYDLFIGPDLDTKHIPKQFEGICREFLIRSNKLNRITPPFFKIGRYYYDIPKLKKNGEFDIVTEDQTGFTFYEVKCRNQPMTPAQIEAEIEQVNASPLKAIRYGFISKSGFKKAEYRNDLVLYDLNDLYADELRG